MKGIRDYIAHIPRKYTEKFKTESGMELFGDHRWMAKEMANTIVDVIETPFFGDTPIKKGYQIFIDSTVVFNQIYEKTGVAESHFLVDKDKGFYKVSKDLIIAYRETEDSEWIAFGDNNLLKRLPTKEEKEDKPKKSLLILPDAEKPKFQKGVAKVSLANKEMNELGVENGTNVYFSELTAIQVFLDGTKYLSVKNRYIIGIKER